MPKNEALLTEYEEDDGDAKSMTAEEEMELLRPGPEEEIDPLGIQEVVVPQPMLLHNPFMGTSPTAAREEYFEALAEIRK
jgi:hypothetical protein